MKLMEVETPAYVVDEGMLKKNLEILHEVQEASGARILLAQKAFSAYWEYPLIGRYLSGTTASGLFEARLGHEEMGLENHVYAPAYHADEMDEILAICDHVIYNSWAQLKKYAPNIRQAKKEAEAAGRKGPEIGMRINPECSTQEDHAIYDPCAPGSRLGVTLKNFESGLAEEPELLELLDGLHFHTLCEQNSDALEVTAAAVRRQFGPWIKQMKWLNMGGGHHITRSDYDREKLIRIVQDMIRDYDVEVYLEPGEAIALNAGYLVTEVMDVVENGIDIAVLDASAACHMPDVLEMPYRPPLRGSGLAGEKAYTARLSSCTCLAGDVIGDYSFDKRLQPGDRLVFEDMAIYSMVKNNTFNGICLPRIYAMDEEGDCRLIKEFGYEDFKCRL